MTCLFVILLDSQRDMVDGAPPHMRQYGGDQRSPNSSFNQGMSATMPRINSGGVNNGGVSLPPQPQQFEQVKIWHGVEPSICFTCRQGTGAMLVKNQKTMVMLLYMLTCIKGIFSNEFRWKFHIHVIL